MTLWFPICFSNPLLKKKGGVGSPSFSPPPFPFPPPPHTTIRHTMCHLLCGGISPHFPHISTIWGFSAIHPLLFIFIFIKIKIKRGRKWGGGGWGGTRTLFIFI